MLVHLLASSHCAAYHHSPLAMAPPESQIISAAVTTTEILVQSPFTTGCLDLWLGCNSSLARFGEPWTHRRRRSPSEKKKKTFTCKVCTNALDSVFSTVVNNEVVADIDRFRNHLDQACQCINNVLFVHIPEPVLSYLHMVGRASSRRLLGRGWSPDKIFFDNLSLAFKTHTLPNIIRASRKNASQSARHKISSKLSKPSPPCRGSQISWSALLRWTAVTDTWNAFLLAWAPVMKLSTGDGLAMIMATAGAAKSLFDIPYLCHATWHNNFAWGTRIDPEDTTALVDDSLVFGNFLETLLANYGTPGLLACVESVGLEHFLRICTKIMITAKIVRDHLAHIDKAKVDAYTLFCGRWGYVAGLAHHILSPTPPAEPIEPLILVASTKEAQQMHDHWYQAHQLWRWLKAGRHCAAPDCLQSSFFANHSFCRCTGCNTAQYCSRTCQSKAWKHTDTPHRSVCKTLFVVNHACGDRSSRKLLGAQTCWTPTQERELRSISSYVLESLGPHLAQLLEAKWLAQCDHATKHDVVPIIKALEMDRARG